MQLEPREKFVVVRQIDDHTDPDTQYVSAQIRNALTDAVIESRLDLTDQGSGRHSKEWQVTEDVQGLGFYISIVTTVYTDSARTTKNENYGEQQQTYLVQSRTVPGGGGSLGGAGVDLEVLRDMLTKIVRGMKFPEAEKLAPLMKEVNNVLEALPGRVAEIIDIPEPVEQKEVDFAPLITALDARTLKVLEAVAGIDIPEHEKVDLSELLSEVKGTKSRLDAAKIDDALKALPKLAEMLRRAPELITALSKVEDAMKDLVFIADKNLAVKSRSKKEKSPMSHIFEKA